ncbi:TraB/GumN family protein [Bacteroides sp.]|uniref:TraB/GumN family protein n=1 Tax=Bacteroides sp. TaxID=29523 RepID=UPI00260EE0BD|nr:TraB/GumN family protein [Bacteroides sp.]MDD3036809.1 TraB/GumN family protein [Bacteroides sp.]
MKIFIGAVILICVALNANAQLLWKISGKNLEKPSYIIGTHHLAPLSIKDSIAGLQKALNETQQVYGELKISDTQTPAAMQKMQKMMMTESDSTLMTLLSPADFETANKYSKEYLMMDLQQVPKLKPAAIQNNIIVVAYIKHIRNFHPQEQLDTYFQTQAIQKGKKVEGLETVEFQFNLLFNGTSLKRQAQLLMCVLNNMDDEIDVLRKVTDAYLKQDLTTMLSLSEERKGNQCDPLPDEDEAMVTNRNQAWVEKLANIMKAAPTFVAVGALHLPGEKGVLNLLKKQGYTVEPVK